MSYTCQLYKYFYILGTEASSYTYVLTEDAELEPFGKVEGREASQRYVFRLYNEQPYVDVEENTGILRLIRQLKSLQRDRNGIRRLTVKLTAEKIHRSFSNFPLHRHAGSIIQVRLVIFPVNFGDDILLKYSQRLRNLIKRSKVFAGRPTSYSLHRFLRMMGTKVESKASNEAYSAVKAKKGIELAIKEIMRKFIPRTGKYKIGLLKLG